MEEYKYMVRTYCATYNQERFIEDALNGFAMQKTNFPVVTTIVDDASTDNTAMVIRGFIENNFNLEDSDVFYEKETNYAYVTYAQHKENKNCYFVFLKLKQNHGSQRKSKYPYLTEWSDNSKYFALCECDDYWTDPLKLQKQVDFLEEHEEYIMCSHAALWEWEGDLYERGCHHNVECALSTDEVIRNGGLYLATASLVFRKELADEWPEWRRLADVGDYPMQILGTLKGGLWFFPDRMCVYRFMHEGSWTSMMFNRRIKHAFNEIEWLGILDEETNKKYHKAIQTHLFSKFIRLLYRENMISTRKYIVSYFEAEKQISVYHFIKDIMRHFIMSIGKGNKSVKQVEQL